MKILLTGSTGFLGRNLQPVLEQEHEVIGIGSSRIDLRNQNNCSQVIQEEAPEVIVHAAGSVGGIQANKENPGKFMYDNLIMGANIIDEIRWFKKTQRGRDIKLIMLGTVCSYPKLTPVPFQEKDLWDGYPEETNAPYGIAKKTLMRLVEAYHEQYGLRGVNLIPVNMYGPYDHFNLTSSHVIPALIVKVQNAIDNNDPYITVWGTGEASREFLFAPDCAEAICLAIDSDVSPEPINIGTGKEVKIRTLVNTICDVMGYQGDIVFDKTKPDGQPRRCLDTSKAKEALGFEAKTSLEDGLEKTINYYRALVKQR